MFDEIEHQAKHQNNVRALAQGKARRHKEISWQIYNKFSIK